MHTHIDLNEIIIKMGIWTTNNGNKHKVNIESRYILDMKARGARFCWIHDNPGINDEKNNTYFEDTVDDGTHRQRRENISVLCEDGENIIGYISHFVGGCAAGTNITNWFIFQPGTYPTVYHTQHSVDEDDVYIEEL